MRFGVGVTAPFDIYYEVPILQNEMINNFILETLHISLTLMRISISKFQEIVRNVQNHSINSQMLIDLFLNSIINRISLR